MPGKKISLEGTVYCKIPPEKSAEEKMEDSYKELTTRQRIDFRQLDVWNAQTKYFEEEKKKQSQKGDASVVQSEE